MRARCIYLPFIEATLELRLSNTNMLYKIYKHASRNDNLKQAEIVCVGNNCFYCPKFPLSVYTYYLQCKPGFFPGLLVVIIAGV